MLKSCSRCGKIHDINKQCPKIVIYRGGQERELRNKFSWQTKRQEIKEKANYLCEVCRDEGVITYDNLEVHHIRKLKDRPDLLLDNMNLVCLCSRHHKDADEGIIRSDYLMRLAKERESR